MTGSFDPPPQRGTTGLDQGLETVVHESNSTPLITRKQPSSFIYLTVDGFLHTAVVEQRVTAEGVCVTHTVSHVY